MFEITLDTAQRLHDEIYHFKNSTQAHEEDLEMLRYNHDWLNANRCIQILDKLIEGYTGLNRFSEDKIKIILPEGFMEKFNSIERKL